MEACFPLKVSSATYAIEVVYCSIGLLLILKLLKITQTLRCYLIQYYMHIISAVFHSQDQIFMIAVAVKR